MSTLVIHKSPNGVSYVKRTNVPQVTRKAVDGPHRRPGARLWHSIRRLMVGAR